MLRPDGQPGRNTNLLNHFAGGIAPALTLLLLAGRRRVLTLLTGRRRVLALLTGRSRVLALLAGRCRVLALLTRRRRVLTLLTGRSGILPLSLRCSNRDQQSERGGSKNELLGHNEISL
jgi:hypothetical protein